jgi:hypothetical protein
MPGKLQGVNMSYKSITQEKNVAWFLPRPKKDKYKGGMPLYCEKWLVELAEDILENHSIRLLNLFCGMNKLGVRVEKLIRTSSVMLMRLLNILNVFLLMLY